MTPLSAVFSAIILSLLLLLIAPLTAYLPIAAMGGIILLVAYNLVDFAQVRSIVRTSWEETAVLVTTFLATLFLELEFAIYAGVLLSLILYLNRTAYPNITNLAPKPDMSGFPLVESEAECLNLKIIRVDGPLLFGAVNHVGEYFANIDKHSNRKRCGYINAIGADNIFATQTEALAKILPEVDASKCQNCAVPLFKQCSVKGKSYLLKPECIEMFICARSIRSRFCKEIYNFMTVPVSSCGSHGGLNLNPN